MTFDALCIHPFWFVPFGICTHLCKFIECLAFWNCSLRKKKVIVRWNLRQTVVGSVSVGCSELEIDKRRGIRTGKLVDDKTGECSEYNHRANGQTAENNAIPAFESVREPVDDHAQAKNQNNGKVGVGHLRQLGQIPGAAYLMNHVAGRFPGDFIRFGRVQIGARSKEEARGSDEYKGEQDVPYEFQSGVWLREEKVVNHVQIDACKNDSAPDCRYRRKGLVEVFVQNGKNSGQQEHQNGADFDFLFAPLCVGYHAQTV